MNPKTVPRSVSPALRAAELSLSATTGAKADGVATNTVTATLKDADGQYVSNTPVAFFILPPASAVFTGGAQQVQVNTGALGEASVDLTDTEAETVSITASATSLSSQTSTTFTSGDGGLLLPPIIEGIFNQSVYLDEMTDPVYINVSGAFLAGDEIVLYLTGNDASGLSVPDKSYSHRVTADTYQASFAVALDELRKYGGTDTHPNDAGTLDIFYTLNDAESLHSSYSVYGTGGVVSHNYTITGTVISASVPADGVSYCSVIWEAQDDGVPVSGLSAILEVGGNAHFTVVSSGRDQSGAATLPAVVNYTNTSPETVIASAVLNGYPDTLTTTDLNFTSDSLGCRDYNLGGENKWVVVTDVLAGFEFVRGQRYKLSVTRSGYPGYAGYAGCQHQIYTATGCVDGTPAVYVEHTNNAEPLYFTSPAAGSLVGLTTNIAVATPIGTSPIVTVCVERA